MSIYLKNATWIDWESLEFTKTHLRVDEGDAGLAFVDTVPASLETKGSGEQVIDCTGRYVTKSFACGHHHIYSALARGMPAPAAAPKNFHEILKYVWWVLDRSLTGDMIRASALVTALYCLKNGVTFVIDHHSSPLAAAGSLGIIAEALEEAGLSHLLCLELSDRDGTEAAEAGLEETEVFLEKHQGLVGLHASFTVGDALLNRAVSLAQKFGTGIHVHAAEDGVDEEHCLRDYGVRVMERYRDRGLLDLEKSIFAHCIHLSEEERNLVTASPAWVVQTPESNLNNAVGILNGRGLKRLMFGTDGMHSDMLRTAKTAFFLASQSGGGLSPPDAYLRFRNVHRYLAESGFSGDGDNNLVILKYDSPTPFCRDNFAGHFVYGLEARHVESVISGGRLVMDRGRVLTVNEEEVLAEAGEQAAALWKRMSGGRKSH